MPNEAVSKHLYGVTYVRHERISMKGRNGMMYPDFSQ